MITKRKVIIKVAVNYIKDVLLIASLVYLDIQKILDQSKQQNLVIFIKMLTVC